MLLYACILMDEEDEQEEEEEVRGKRKVEREGGEEST